MGRTKVVEAPKGKRNMKKNKKPKDKNAPKKPTTAFFYFVASRRAQKADQGLKVSEFTKECGALWRELEKEDKEKYDKQAAGDKIRYQKAMAIYNPSSVPNPDEPPKPKKAATAFILFTNEMRPKLIAQGFDQKNVLVESGRLWKQMDDEEKSEWNDASAVEKKKYEKAMEKYNEELKSVRSGGGAAQNGGAKAKKVATPPPPPPPQPQSDEDMDDDDDEDGDVESDDE